MKNDPNLIDPGTPFGGGFYGGRVRIDEAVYAVVWAPKADGETTNKWQTTAHDLAGATSCFDSMANTNAMALWASQIALWAKTLKIGGHTDWCVPARDVLELGYRLLKPGPRVNLCSFRDGDNASSVPVGYPYTEQSPTQTGAEAFRTGEPEAFDENWYWSSTPSSADDAFIQDFLNGNQSTSGKKYEARVRAVRLIQLTP